MYVCVCVLFVIYVLYAVFVDLLSALCRPIRGIDALFELQQEICLLYGWLEETMENFKLCNLGELHLYCVV